MNIPKKVPSLILASSSPQRLALLEQLDISPIVAPSSIDELVKEGESPEALVCRLAVEKAASVAESQDPFSVVIGADSIVDLDGKILGKPVDEQEAFEMLRSLVGRSHRVLTGVCVISEGVSVHRYAETFVHLRDVSEEELRSYVACGESLGRAGACCVQGRGALFVKRFEGTYHNVVGLPVNLVAELCEKVGWPLQTWMAEESSLVL